MSKTLVTYLIDESGSMSGVARETRAGFNRYIDEVRKVKGMYITLATFDSRGTRVPFLLQKAKNVPEIGKKEYKPYGSTPLYDAIGQTIEKMERKVKDFKNPNVVLFINTDGEENSSHEYSQREIKRLIQRKQNDGWNITFLGADLDVRQFARDFDINFGNIKSYSKVDTPGMFGEMATRTIMYSNVGGKVDDFMSSQTFCSTADSVEDFTSGGTSAKDEAS